MTCPTIAQTATALRTKLAAMLAGESGVQIVPETESFEPNAGGIMCLQSFRPSSSETAELGGRAGLARRHGLYLITFSAPWGAGMAADVQRLAELCMAGFRQLELATDGGPVYTDEPVCVWGEAHAAPTPAGGTQTEVIGKDPDGRYSMSVAVPWTAWTGGNA